MKFSSDKSRLYEVIQPSLPAVSTRNENKALEGLLLEADSGLLRVCGYDLEKGIQNSLRVEVEETGSCVAPAQRFASIVRSMPDGRVDVQIDSRCVMKLTGGPREFELHCLPADNYPVLPELREERSVSLSAQTLKSMLTGCMFAAGHIESRPVLGGVYFDCKDNVLRTVALDLNRLAVRTSGGDSQVGGDEIKFVVPVKSLTELIKLMSNEEDTVRLSLTRRHVVVKLGDVVFFSRLLEGEYLEWENFIPRDFTATAVVSVEKMRDSFESAALFCTDKIPSPVVCSFSDNILDISCETQSGRVHDSFAIEYGGGPVRIGFNHRYMLDALGACGVDNVKIGLSSPHSGVVITAVDEKERFMYMVLPRKIRD